MMSLPVWLPGPMFLPGGSLSGGVSLQRPPDKDPLYGKERTGRILLECVLVVYVHKLSWAKDTSYLYRVPSAPGKSRKCEPIFPAMEKYANLAIFSRLKWQNLLLSVT